MRVLYVLGCNEGASKRYRVFNHIEALAHRKIHAEWIWEIHPEAASEDFLSGFNIVVNFRSGYSDRIETMLAVLKRLKIPCVYDIDDLVFDPELVDQVDAYRRMSESEKQDYLHGVRSVSRALMASDFVTASTPFLSDYARKYTGKNTWLIPLGLNDQQVSISARVRGESRGARFIGYLSGTKTHEQDFAQVAPALLSVLASYPDVYLKLVGHLDIDTHLPGLRHKVLHLPFLDWQDLVVEVASLYVNLAPLDASSAFCQSKSDLKYFEAALSGVPTIASPVSSFMSSIVSGKNGIIASSDSEWLSGLKLLLDDQALRDRMGREAFQHVQRERFPYVIGRKLEDTYSCIIKEYQSSTFTEFHSGPGKAELCSAPIVKSGAKGRLRITWVIPQPFEASGGHRNIFRTIRFLSEFGHSCTIHVLPDNQRFNNGDQIREFITREFFDVKAEAVWHGCDHIAECDVLVCTYWTTAYVVKENAEKAALHVYFIQDYEPYFFPMGTDYVRARESYRFGFYPITSGPWPLHMLQTEVGITRGSYFRFPIDRSVYYPPVVREQDGPARVIYFARPDMPRRCYPLGLAALELVKQERPEVEIAFFGDKAEKYSHVSFPITNVGMTPSIEGLGNLYRSADVGLCFSTTNPSLVPFEMMACGLPVVDLDLNGNEVSYGGRGNCVLASANPRDIADKIYSVLDNPGMAKDMIARGIQYVTQFPTEVEMVRLIEKIIMDAYASR